MKKPLISTSMALLLFGAIFFLGIFYITHWKFTAFIGWGFSILALIRLLNRASLFFPAKARRSIQWIHAMAFELFAYVATFLSHPVGYTHFYRRAAGKAVGRPILLIHGYCNDGSVWIFHKSQISKAGLGPIYSMNLGFPFRPIRDYAEKVKQKADEMARQTGRCDLILIGHSMGGLVGSLYATEFALKGSVTDLIMIGTPFRGTPLAHLGVGPNAREMRPHSPFLKKLAKALEANKGIRVYSIATKTDQIVMPLETALATENPRRQLILEDIGHQSLLYSKRISEKISDWLNLSD